MGTRLNRQHICSQPRPHIWKSNRRYLQYYHRHRHPQTPYRPHRSPCIATLEAGKSQGRSMWHWPDKSIGLYCTGCSSLHWHSCGYWCILLWWCSSAQLVFRSCKDTSLFQDSDNIPRSCRLYTAIGLKPA